MRGQSIYQDAEHVRRKVAAAYRKRSTDKRHSPAERAEFARMADAWKATLPKRKLY
jgi:hypothetical protein